MDTYVLGRIVFGGQADKDLLGIPVKQGRKVGIDVERDLDKVLDVSVHMPRRSAAHHFELVDDDLAGRMVGGEAGEVDEDDEHKHNSGGERRHGIEPRERAVHLCKAAATRCEVSDGYREAR